MKNDFKFYNKGIAKQNPIKNINLFAQKYQDEGNPDAPLNPLRDKELEEIFELIRSCILDTHFLAFAGEQKALVNHILEYLNEDLPNYLQTIKKAALSTDVSVWEAMKKTMTEAYCEY